MALRPFYLLPFTFCLLLPTTILSAPREFSFDLWDWTHPCRDLPTFKQWAADLKHLGVTHLEISAPWTLLEPTPNHYDFSFIADRLAVADALHLKMRVRINSYYNGATPPWYQGHFWRDINNNPPTGTPTPPSIADDRFWQSFSPMLTALAREFKDRDLLYSPFIGIHAELKFADWWHYDPACLEQWRTAIHATPRPDWLTTILPDNPELPDLPPIPPQTQGQPDTTPASLATIAFREHLWRRAVEKFNTALRQGDPTAKTSAPLGESYRKQSAQFSNQDYFGLSRGAIQVVHSYDFYWHPKDPIDQAAFAVATFRGITQLPVEFEFDGPDLTDRLHYSVDHLTQLAQSAVSEGAGLKAANYSYSEKLPSTYPALQSFTKILTTAPPIPTPAPKDTILLFLSKWTTYCYREPTEWLHQSHYAAWRMLRTEGYPVRIICEDNLTDPTLPQYRGLYIAFAPPQTIPPTFRTHLTTLSQSLPTLTDLPPTDPNPTSTSSTAAQWLKDLTTQTPTIRHLLTSTFAPSPKDENAPRLTTDN